MKVEVLKTICLTTILIFGIMVNSQSTQTGIGFLGHQAGGAAGAYYLGWNAATGIPLQIRHDGTQNITFHTGERQGWWCVVKPDLTRVLLVLIQ